MREKILILNPKHNLNSLFDILEALSLKDFQLLLLSKDNGLLKRFKEKSLEARHLAFWPDTGSDSKLSLAILLFPFTLIYLLLFLIIIKRREKLSKIIITGNFEVIFLAPLAKLLGVKTYWLVYPDLINRKVSPIIAYPTRFFSRYSNIIAITKNCQDYLLDRKYQSAKIHAIAPSIKTEIRHQENLFEKMAEIDKNNQSKKFFTLGMILDLENKQNLETIFQAIKKVTTVVPNIQLIIIGDGAERKNLDWLAKKVGIGNLTWFVGKQNNLIKWLNNLDIFLASTVDNNLFDINNTLYAMNEHLPVIAPAETYWLEIIENQKNGIILKDFNSDTLSQEIISLNQDPVLCQSLGKNAKEAIDKSHRIDKVIAQFVEILK